MSGKVEVGNQTLDARIRKADIESNTAALQVEVNAKGCMFEANGRKKDLKGQTIKAGDRNICQHIEIMTFLLRLLRTWMKINLLKVRW